jgi:hypothetical protein
MLCDYFLQQGQERSLIDGEPVGVGFRLLLQDMEPLARALVAAGRGSELLSICYIGQELRDINTSKRFKRVFDHLMGQARGAAQGPGSSTVGQFVRWTTRKDGGKALTPFKPRVAPPKWQRRVLALLPHSAGLVHAAEALLVAACTGFGSFIACDSPGGKEPRRYLAPHWDGSPCRMLLDLAALLSSMTLAAAQSSPLSSVEDGMLARVLQLMERYLRQGICRSPTGAQVQPALRGGRFSLWQCASALQALNSTVAREPFNVLVDFDWCGLCTAVLRRSGKPCKHLIYCRGLYMMQNAPTSGLAPKWPWWASDTPVYINFKGVKLFAPDGEEEVQVSRDMRMTPAAVGAMEQIFSGLSLETVDLLSASAAAVAPDSAHAVMLNLARGFRAAAAAAEEAAALAGASSSSSSSSSIEPLSPQQHSPAWMLVEKARSLHSAMRRVLGHPPLQAWRTTVSGSTSTLTQRAMSEADVMEGNMRTTPVAVAFLVPAAAVAPEQAVAAPQQAAAAPELAATAAVAEGAETEAEDEAEAMAAQAMATALAELAGMEPEEAAEPQASQAAPSEASQAAPSEAAPAGAAGDAEGGAGSKRKRG